MYHPTPDWADFKKLVDAPVTYATENQMPPILQIFKHSLEKHLYVLPGQVSKGIGQLYFQSLNRLSSPDGHLSLCKSYAKTWDPLNALLNMGKH